MCGLAGIAGDLTLKAKDGFRDLLLITQLRGTDATGVFTVKGDDSTSHIKGVGTPEILMDRKGFDDVMKGLPKIIAGHCRAKTAGDNTVANAHPYDFDNVVGMHNGTLNSYYHMEGYDHKKTDSYALYHSINHHGIEETIKNLDASGAWALVFWDKVENRLNFIRNEKRPLWFAWTKNKKCIIWASEPWMFSAIGRKEELWDGSPEVEGDKPRSPYFQLPPDQLWSFTINDRPAKDEKVLTLHAVRELKAEGKGRTTGFNYSRWNKGGEVPRPFQIVDSLDDSLEGLPGLPGPKKNEATTPTQGESQITTFGVPKSETPSSKTSDFRPASMRGTNSQRPVLSLPQSKSQDTQQKASGGSSEESKPYASSKVVAFPKVSLRRIKGLGDKLYITDHKTGVELSPSEFEERTDGVCSYCKAPIGDLSEVAEFVSPNLTRFVCTSCLNEPKLSVA